MDVPNLKPIEIDISQVVLLGKQTDPMFQLCLADVRAKLADPDEVNAICIHEAAHLFYMTKAGMRDPEFTGPKIVYNSETGKFDRYGAAVRCPNRDNAYLATLNFGQWSILLAKAHAAGGAAMRLLANRPDAECGDSEDRENFDRAYAMLRTLAPDLTATADALWGEAQRILGLELQQKPRIELILQMADTIKPELFKS